MNAKTIDSRPALAKDLAQHVIDNAVDYAYHTLDPDTNAGTVVHLVVEKLANWLDSGRGDEERCVFCDERKPPHEFNDGLRCKACAEEQDKS